MSVINTNIAGKIATNAIIRNDRMQETAMERLSTGLRINSAKDDAAGLAISQRMRAEVSGLEMATRNANDAISMLETAEGATLEIANMLQRMRELAVQSSSETLADTERSFISDEFNQLRSEVGRIASVTEFNGLQLADGTSSQISVQVGIQNASSSRISIQLGDLTTSGLSIDSLDLSSSTSTFCFEARSMLAVMPSRA